MAQQVWTSWPGGIGWPTAIPLSGGRKKTRKARKSRKATRKGRKATRRMRGGKVNFTGLKEQTRKLLGPLKNAYRTTQNNKKPSHVNQAIWNAFIKQRDEYDKIEQEGREAQKRINSGRASALNVAKVQKWETTPRPKNIYV